jgi:DNA-binding CsgD family transcriptional regulator
LGAISLGYDDRIRSTTGAARAWLATYFDHPATADSLPDTIRAWLRRLSLPASGDEMMPDVASALVIDHGGARLKLRLIRHSRQRMILMQEQCTTPRPEHLAALGLAPREAEILTWVAAGKSDAEIGQILSISPRTVSHTLERVYRKLGVETRTAAAMRALSTGTAQL